MAKTKKSTKRKVKKEERKNALALLNMPNDGWDENDENHKEYVKRDVRGRPTVMTKQTLQKLREAFRIGCSDVEACIYAGIAEQTLYNYCKKFPYFLEEKQELKETRVIVSRATVFRSLATSAADAWKMLEKTRKKEFAELKLTAELEDAITTDELERLSSGNYEVVEPENSKD